MAPNPKHPNTPGMTCQSDIAQTQETPLMRGGLGNAKNLQTHRTKSSKILAKSQKKNLKSIPMSFSHAFLATSWVICAFSKVSSYPVQKNLGTGVVDTAFKRRRPRWKRAKSGSSKSLPHQVTGSWIKNHPCLHELFENRLKNR